MSTFGDSTERLTRAPETTHPGETSDSIALPVRPGSSYTNFAGGNGGQISMGIPELGLAIVFTGGNYADPVLFTSQRKYVPEFILPAVK